MISRDLSNSTYILCTEDYEQKELQQFLNVNRHIIKGKYIFGNIVYKLKDGYIVDSLDGSDSMIGCLHPEDFINFWKLRGGISSANRRRVLL